MAKHYSDRQKRTRVKKILEYMKTMSCSRACKKVKISQTTFDRWVKDLQPDKKDGVESYSEWYDDSRKEYIERLADEILSIVDAPANKVEGKVDTGEVSQKRLRIDSRKWLLSKLAPAIYGEKLNVEGVTNNTTTNNITILNDLRTMEKKEVDTIRRNVIDALKDFGG